jgi:hypothetical protein
MILLILYYWFSSYILLNVISYLILPTMKEFDEFITNHKVFYWWCPIHFIIEKLRR